MSTFFLRIATPDSDVYSGETEYLSLNTPDGREGFMRGCLPRVLVMASGRIEISEGDEKKIFDSADGIVCVDADGVTVLTSHCVSAKSEEVRDDRSARNTAGRQYRYAKARLVSNIQKSKNKAQSDE